MFLRLTILIYQQNIDSVCFDVEFLCYVNILSYYCVCVLAHLGKKKSIYFTFQIRRHVMLPAWE